MSMRLFGVRTLVLANFALMQAAPAIAEAVPVKLPELSPEAQTGGQLFIQNCAQCHGMVGGGTNNGPPLIQNSTSPITTAISPSSALPVTAPRLTTGASATCRRSRR